MNERGNRNLRALDKVIGTALLRAISVPRRKRKRPETPDRIGLLCVGAIGDLLLASPIVGDLRTKFPNARIVILGSSANKVLAPLLGNEEFVDLNVTYPVKALAQLRALKLDLLIDTTQWARFPALLSALSGAHCIGFRTPGQPRHFCYDEVIAHRNDRHEVDNFRALVAGLADIAESNPKLFISQAAIETVTKLELNRYAVLHAWPSGINSHLKEWSHVAWQETASKLAERGLRVVLTGAPADAGNSAGLARRLSKVADVTDLAGKLKLEETAALLKNSACVISVNTGVMHIAAALNVPLIALNGPTNPSRWGPLSTNACNMTPAKDGCGYLNLGFEYPLDPPDCMGAIAGEAVAREIDRILG